MGTFTLEPPRGRPDSPPQSYGVPRRGGEFVSWERVLERLRTAEAYWLATVTPGGRPHVVPIWGVFVEDELYLETGAPGTIKNRNLAANPEVAVHLDGINDAIIVRGVGEATKPERRLGEALAAAFAAKYKGYDPTPDSWDRGGLYRIAPRTILAWLAMPTATRWRFPVPGATGSEESR